MDKKELNEKSIDRKVLKNIENLMFNDRCEVYGINPNSRFAKIRLLYKEVIEDEGILQILQFFGNFLFKTIILMICCLGTMLFSETNVLYFVLCYLASFVLLTIYSVKSKKWFNKIIK